MRKVIIYFLLVQLVQIITINAQVSVVTVASNVKHPGFKKLLLSAKAYNIHLINLSKNNLFKNRSLKIRLLRDYLFNIESEEPNSHIILFVDGLVYDVVFLSDLDEVIRKFKQFSMTKVLFSAEIYCYPKPHIAKSYPREDKSAIFSYLNSGGIIGYLPYMKRIVNYKTHIEGNDDQLYYTLIYLNKSLRRAFSMSLDHDANIFLNLGGNEGRINVINTTKGYLVKNTVTKQQSLIIHGQGCSGKTIMNQLYTKYLKYQFNNIQNLNNQTIDYKIP